MKKNQATAPCNSTDIFAPTRWTVVLAAGRKSSVQSDRALEELCRAYWFPLYAYIRRRGFSREDAEDLTQGFFARFLGKNYLGGLSAERGKFRAFLLASLKHFLANEQDKSLAQKRGGGAAHFSLDWRSADAQFQLPSTACPSPDRAFDREWALTLLGKVLDQLCEECETEGRARHFDELKVFLTAGKGARSCAAAAKSLGMEEGAVRVAIHRLRKRYRALLRSEIAQTVSSAAEVDGEIEALFDAMREE